MARIQVRKTEIEVESSSSIQSLTFKMHRITVFTDHGLSYSYQLVQ